MQSETLAQEFARLVKEYHEGDDHTKPEAWNLLADYAVDNADAISAALSGKPAVEVKAQEILDRSKTIVEDVIDMALYLRNCPRENIGKYQDAANRLAAFMEELRSALVDVPVEAVEPDWWLVTTEMGKVIFHGPDKDRAERVAAMRGRPVTPLYASPSSRNALDKERG